MRVAATCYAYDHSIGSESELGYSWCKHIRKINAHLIVITTDFNYLRIKSPEIYHCSYGLCKVSENIVVKNVDLGIFREPPKNHYIMIVHYIAWQILAAAWLSLRLTAIDLIHHVTFVSAWIPPFCSILDKPLIWAPVGTSSPIPKWGIKSLKDRLWNFITQNPGIIWPRIFRYFVNRASLIGVISSNVKGIISPYCEKSPIELTAIAYDGEDFQRRTASREGEHFKILYPARYTTFKFPHFALDVARIISQKHSYISFDVIGEGYPSSFIRQHSAYANFLGSLPRQDFLDYLNNYQLVVLPTTEPSSYVSLEALAAGIPIVTFTNSGPSKFISSSLAGSSIEINGDNYSETLSSFVDAISYLIMNAQAWQEKSDAAVILSSKYTSRSLQGVIEKIYDHVK